MAQTITLLIGTENYYEFFIGLFFLIVGILLSLQLHANSRDIHSPRTAMHFSYRFLFNDNVKRLLLSIVLSIIVYRFSNHFFSMNDRMFVAFIIGFSFDKLAQKAKELFTIFK